MYQARTISNYLEYAACDLSGKSTKNKILIIRVNFIILLDLGVYCATEGKCSYFFQGKHCLPRQHVPCVCVFVCVRYI